MNRWTTALGRVALAICVVVTCGVVVFVVACASTGAFRADRVDRAVRAMRGEVAPAKAAEVVRVASAPSGDLRELETLVAMAEARDSDLRSQFERIRREKKTAATVPTEPAPVVEPAVTPGDLIPISATPVTATEAFKGNLAILRNHVPKTAATLMSNWETADIVPYLRAMKPYEAADILAALLALGQKGEVDCAQKARDAQEALGK